MALTPGTKRDTALRRQSGRTRRRNFRSPARPPPAPAPAPASSSHEKERVNAKPKSSKAASNNVQRSQLALTPRACATKKSTSSKEYEMKFASLELILAVLDLEASDPKQKYALGRLREDVLMGADPEAEVGVDWFEHDEELQAYVCVQGGGEEDKEEDDDEMVVIGSLVCAVTEYSTEVESDDGVETIKLSDQAFEYSNRKLQEQLQDDYATDDDSQFGDAAVSKRIQNGTSNLKVKPDDEDGEEDSEGNPSGKKKRKRAASKSKNKSKNKSSGSARGLTPRPDVEQKADLFLTKTGKLEDFFGDHQRATKEVVRAVRSGDDKLLKVACASRKIHSIHYPQCYALPMSPLMWSMVLGDTAAFKELLGAKRLDNRTELQPCMLPSLTTGKQTSRFANYNRGAVGASRGGREGNNALLHDSDGYKYLRYNLGYRNGELEIGAQCLPLEINELSAELTDFRVIRDFDEISDTILDLAEASFSRYPREEYITASQMVRAGHHNMARRIIDADINRTYDSESYNLFHLESLSNDMPADPLNPFSKKILSRSVAKKSSTETRFSPLACACINPNLVFLKAMLAAAPEQAMTVDNRGTTLLHYAAACKSNEAIIFLLNKFSLPRNIPDKDKCLAIHYAASAGRAENIRALLEGIDEEQQTTMLNAKNVNGYAAIHCATNTRRSTRADAVRELLDAGSVADTPSSASRNRVSPVHIAARLGDLELLNLLLERGGSPRKGDKLNRTPLIHACMNGHVHVVSRLLSIGVDTEAADSSDNRAMHYAVAYGWEICVDQLLEVGANPDPENSWKVTPLAIAVEKGRHHISRRLLKLPSVNVNTKDDNGRTMLQNLSEIFISTALMRQNPTKEAEVSAGIGESGGTSKNMDAEGEEEKKAQAVDESDGSNAQASLIDEMPWTLRSLLERKDLNVSMASSDGQDVMRTLFSQKYPVNSDGEDRALVFVKMMIARGWSDIAAEDKKWAIHAALAKNKKLFEFLVENGASVDHSSTCDDYGRNIIHCLIDGADPSIDLLALLKERISEDSFNALACGIDSEHRTPFLRAAATGDASLIQFFINNISNMDLPVKDKGQNNIVHCLIDGSKMGCDQHLALLKEKISNEEAFRNLISVPNKNGRTPLVRSVAEDNLPLFQFLIENGAEVECEDEKSNILHQMIESGKIPGKQFAILHKHAPNGVFKALLSSPDSLGRSPLHLAMIQAAIRSDETISQQWIHLVKSVLTSFPDLATIKIAPYGYLRDVDWLAESITANDDHFGHKDHQKKIWGDADRVGPDDMSDAISRPLVVVPFGPKRVGESLVHIICATAYIHRIAEVLDWLLPLAKDVATSPAGRAGLLFTPLQALLRRLPGSTGDKKASLLSAASAIKKVTGEDVNLRPAKKGGTPTSSKILTEEELDRVDKAAVEELRCEARKFVAGKGDKQMIIGLFAQLMARREARINSLFARQDDPLAIQYAKRRSDPSGVPIETWNKLIDEFHMEVLPVVSDDTNDTILHVAMRNKDKPLCQLALDQYPSLLSKPNKEGRRPIHLAAILDDPFFVNFVLDNVENTKAEVNQADKAGRTPFHLSVYHASVRSVEALKPCEVIFSRAGALLNKTDGSGRTPLHYCFISISCNLFGFPHSCAANETHDRVELVGALLNAEGAIDAAKAVDEDGRSPLHYAAAYNSTIASLLLIGKGSKLFEKDKDGNTPINVAMLRGFENYTIMMLKSSGSLSNASSLVDVNDVRRTKKKGKDGQWKTEIISKQNSIIWHAIKRNMRGLVYVLLEAMFPLFQASVDALELGNFTLFKKLIAISPPEVVQKVGRMKRNLLHEVSNVATYSMPEWSTTLAKELMQGGLSAVSKDADNKMPLHLAASRGHLDLIKLLINVGPSVLLEPDNHGNTPLAWYIKSLTNLTHVKDPSTHMEILKQLIGPDPLVLLRADADGDVPLVRFVRSLPALSFFGRSSALEDMAVLLIGPHSSILAAPDRNGMTPLGQFVESLTCLSYFDRSPEPMLKVLLRNKLEVLLKPDQDGLIPVQRFFKSLPFLNFLKEEWCVSVLELLASEKGILKNPANNVIEIVRKETSVRTVKYIPMEFEPGPNRGSVEEELARSLLPPSKATKSKDIPGLTTLVFRAIETRRFVLLQSLFSMGALLDLVDGDGLSPLHHAVLDSSMPMLHMLLRNGANPNVVTEEGAGLTPLVIVSMRTANATKANRDESLEIIQLLLRYGASVCIASRSTRMTALHYSCAHNDLALARLLLRSAKIGNDTLPKPSQHHNSNVEPSPNGHIIRIGNDVSGLYPAKVCSKDGKCFFQVHDPMDSAIPVQLATEVYSSKGLALDSKQGLAKLAMKSGISGISTNKDGSVKVDSGSRAGQMLDQYYGIEGRFLSDSDASLTSPLKSGDAVLMQTLPPETKYTSDQKKWLRGTVVVAHNNGTYDVDIICGFLELGVFRQQLRPWKPTGTKVSGIDTDHLTNISSLMAAKDIDGRTPIQIAVKALPFGSFENVEMVWELLNSGAEVDSDTLSMARRGSEVHKICFERAFSAVDDEMDVDSSPEQQDQAQKFPKLEPISDADFDFDVVEAWKRLESENPRRNAPPKLNRGCQIRSYGARVLPVNGEHDAEIDQRFYYDIVMINVEISSRQYSENKYYKMQIVEDPIKNLFVLLTNWGHIGDCGGQRQQTPFGTPEEAVAEFCKVFKAKSGNLWGTFLQGKFEAMLNKYKPVALLPDGFEYPELPALEAMADDEKKYPNVKRTSMLPPSTEGMLRAMTNPDSISKAVGAVGLCQKKLPLGRLSVKAILDAEKKLDEIEAQLQAVQKLQKVEHLGDRRDAIEKSIILSNQYYELMPTAEDDKVIQPFNERTLELQRAHLLGLKDLSIASQIVTVASKKASATVNPFDYVYSALNTRIGILPQMAPDRIGIEQYFRNTCNNRDIVINEVFALDRTTEISNTHLNNHRLLWHGTHATNLAGVLKGGLRVAPVSAQISGALFGRGVYFADQFSKSFSYCRADLRPSSTDMPRAYLLLADVALGKQAKVSDTFSGDGSHNYGPHDSLWAVGYEGPDTEKDITFGNGVVVPVGKVVRTPSFKPRGVWWNSYYAQIDRKASAKIEEARNSPETIFPATVRTVINNIYYDVILEHGPNSTLAKAVPVKKKKRNTSDPTDQTASKKQRTDDGAIDKNSHISDVAEEDEDNAQMNAPELNLKRREDNIANHVHYNEYIVRNPEHVNLRYIVEVTSRAWLTTDTRKRREEAEKRLTQEKKSKKKMKPLETRYQRLSTI